ncbi:hypothetical protein [Woodsholea maritima]|uniref:hypothetical protein n=1 Tax=Woodsholea maritima TaxID=240237 RepID=UPI000361C42C|nr:hypothetical protein [Woodsholea maritima]
MKQLLLVTVATSFMSGCVVVKDYEMTDRADAPSRITQDTLITLDEPGDFRLTAQSIEINGQVQGQLRLQGRDVKISNAQIGALDVSAQSLRLNARVHDGLNASAQTVWLSGDIGGPSVINAQRLHMDGDIHGAFIANAQSAQLQGTFSDITFSGQFLQLDANTRVYGPATFNVREGDIHGQYEGPVSIVMAHGVLSGNFHAPISVISLDDGPLAAEQTGLVTMAGRFVGGQICADRVAFTGVSDGVLTIIANHLPVIESANDNIRYIPRQNLPCERF